MTKLARGTISYTKRCPRCGTYVRLTADELHFDGVTCVSCPRCGLTIKFTGDLGFVEPETETELEERFTEVSNDQCREDPADDR